LADALGGLATTQRRVLRLGAVLLVAFGLRLAWALNVEPANRHAFVFDATFYDWTARFLLAGEGYLWSSGEPTAYFPPGYPILLAGVYWLFWPSLTVAQLFNVFLGTTTCLFTYLIGRQAYSETVGITGAAILAAFPSCVFSVSTTVSEVAFSFALTGTLAGFLAMDRSDASRHPARWLVVGMFSGATVLVRGVALLVPSVYVACWWFRDGLSKPLWLRTLWLGLGFVAFIAPWTIRNWVVMGEPILVSTDGAYVLFNSHSPVADGGQSLAMNRLRDELFGQYNDLPRQQKEVAMERAQTRYALRYMLTHPLEELRLWPQRFRLLYVSDHWPYFWLGEIPERGQRRLMAEPWQSRWARIADGYFYGVAVLAAVGFALAWLPRRRAGLVVPMTVLYFHLLYVVLFYGSPRLHASFVPLLAILAALTLTWPALRRRADAAVAEAETRAA
jgi:4-amino-4-deoxy-L-arabinose transferase-like glycosyltransferase